MIQGVRSRKRGMSLAISVLCIALLAVVAFATGAVGIQQMYAATLQRDGAAAQCAAEAGIEMGAASLQVNDTANGALFSRQPIGATAELFTLTATNNFFSSSNVTSSSGVVVPAGLCLLESTGFAGGTTQTVRALLHASRTTLGYAIQSGSGLSLAGTATVQGSIRSNGTLSLTQGNSSLAASGANIYSGADIANSNAAVRLSTGGEEVRARTAISDPSQISGTSLIYASDTTSFTDQMAHDGSLSPPSTGTALPNPNRSTLLVAGQFTQHSETSFGGGETLDLNGGIHYFPNGVRFGSGSHITGSGTIVVDNGSTARFSISVGNPGNPASINIIALDGQGGTRTPGTGGIQFDQSANISGLIYSHNNVSAASSLSVGGSIVTYNGSFTGSGTTTVLLSAVPGALKGFENWIGGGPLAGGGPISTRVVSWHTGR